MQPFLVQGVAGFCQREKTGEHPVVWSRNAPPSTIRALARDWGPLEWGQTAINLAASCMYAWPIAMTP
jgi:hypothetical protein